MKTLTINLEQYRTEGLWIFVGREKGKNVRELSRIDILEPEHDKITVEIPENTHSANPSFLEEFLRNVVSKLGEKRFHEKFSFVCPGKYKIDADLEEAVRNILRESIISKN